MNLLARILSFFPFYVDVSGTKRDLIVRLGDAIVSNKKLSAVRYKNHVLDIRGSDYFKIVGYATANYFRGYYKSDLGQWMQANLKSGDRFADVGANLGGYSFLASSLGARVTYFEPVPELFEILQRNPLTYGQGFPYALSDEAGKLTFHLSGSNIGGSSLVESSGNNSGYSDEVEVDVRTFDETMRESLSKIEPWRMIKIDVEGNEEKVVRGMKQHLEANAIEAIWCEVRGDSSDRNPGSFRKVISFLGEFGFAPYLYSGGEKVRFDPSFHLAPQYFDLLFEKQ